MHFVFSKPKERHLFRLQERKLRGKQQKKNEQIKNTKNNSNCQLAWLVAIEASGTHVSTKLTTVLHHYRPTPPQFSNNPSPIPIPIPNASPRRTTTASASLVRQLSRLWRCGNPFVLANATVTPNSASTMALALAMTVQVATDSITWPVRPFFYMVRPSRKPWNRV